MNLHAVLWPIDDWPAMASTWQRAEELGFTGGWVYDHLAWRGHTPWDDAYASLAAAAAGHLADPARHPGDDGQLPDSDPHRLGDPHHRPDLGRPADPRHRRRRQHAHRRRRRPRPRLDATRAGRPVRGVGVPARRPVDRRVGVGHGGVLVGAGGHHRPGLVQQRPPFWIAGNGPRGMRLAARLGQGWVANPGTSTPYDETRTQLARLQEACEAAGRDFAAMPRLLLTGFTDEPWLASTAAYDDLAGRYAELGITDVAVHWPRPGTEWDADMAVFEAIAANAG